MKVLFKCVFLFLCVCILSGWGKENGTDILKRISKKIENLDSYHLTGELEIVNNENSYLYDVDVSFLKDNNFKVCLKNKTNNHEQIILRNSDGVFVLNPGLNKSFKFQSDWPFNNSQSYLLHNLINDMNSDENLKIENDDSGYVFTAGTNYSNNKELVVQKIYISDDGNIYKVEVYDSNNIKKLVMNITNIDYNFSFDDDDFMLDTSLSSGVIQSTVSKIDDVVYPMYIPMNTYLSSQDKVSFDDGERIILTFAGDYPFMLIQETLNSNDSPLISVSGEPFQLSDSIAVIDDSSITWISDGIEYYLVSNVLDQTQLIDVANSITVASIVKWVKKNKIDLILYLFFSFYVIMTLVIKWRRQKELIVRRQIQWFLPITKWQN